jgi:hypothetical protein
VPVTADPDSGRATADMMGAAGKRHQQATFSGGDTADQYDQVEYGTPLGDGGSNAVRR